MGGDMMEFPDTVEEFMQEYKMVDRHEIYSNGTEYVPIFRMEQWFEHCRAIEKITQEDIDYWHKLSQSYEKTIYTLAQAIAEHGEKRWIPCSERLPEKDGRYWISTKTITCEDNFENGEFVFYRSNVLAWMPLPQPWKREKEEGEPIPQWRGCMDGCLPYYDGKEMKE